MSNIVLEGIIRVCRVSHNRVNGQKTLCGSILFSFFDLIIAIDTIHLVLDYLGMGMLDDKDECMNKVEHNERAKQR